MTNADGICSVALTGQVFENLHRYEVVVPTLVDEAHEFLSYDVTRQGVEKTKSRRRRREVTAADADGGFFLQITRQ